MLGHRLETFLLPYTFGWPGRALVVLDKARATKYLTFIKKHPAFSALPGPRERHEGLVSLLAGQDSPGLNIGNQRGSERYSTLENSHCGAEVK